MIIIIITTTTISTSTTTSSTGSPRFTIAMRSLKPYHKPK